MQQNQRCSGCGGDACNANNGAACCWQYIAQNKQIQSNSSSTSSGCDSNASSKENYFVPQPKSWQQQQQQQQQQRQTRQQQHYSITPKQLQQLRYYQQVQQQQLHLLQQQLLQRKRLQQQLREQGVLLPYNTNNNTNNTNNINNNNNTNISYSNTGKHQQHRQTKATLPLTCNQQYLLQQRLQQQHVYYNYNYNNNYNEFDILNNNTNNNYNNNENNNYVNALNLTGIFGKGQKLRRGMTELSVNNDNITNHLSQPLQNSPIHHYTKHLKSHQTLNLNSTAKYHPKQSQQPQQQNHCNSTKLPLNSSANIINTTSKTPASAIHSPLHYKNPLNSPNNSPFVYAYHQQHQLKQKSDAAAARLRSCNNKLSGLPQTQYQQHLNDRLLQQQLLQQQQQQLLSSAKTVAAAAKTNDVAAAASAAIDDELSEESLKQNVAIVLSNLDRYNNALRSVILNEQVISNSSIFCDDSILFDVDIDVDGDNDNYDGGGCKSNNNNNNNINLLSNKYKMATTATATTTAVTPESDYNSNATTPGSRSSMPLDSNLLQQHQQQYQLQQQQQHGVGNGGGGGFANINAVGAGIGECFTNTIGNNLNCSLASSHDFTHDNSDYQWFLDYGYRDGCGGMQRSVLSSLSASYNAMGDLIYYEDLAKNIDANLAEVDMESFRAEDIHSLLSNLPAYCKSLGTVNSRLQQSLLLQQQQQLQQQQLQQQQQHQQLPMLQTVKSAQQTSHYMSQTSSTSTNELIDNSFCKSELLFSPVKESHISVDSLDMDAYPDDGDIILTCKANKDNYTIAFEGSVLYSDESFYAEPNEIAIKNKQNFINLHNNLEDIVNRKALEVSMSRSELVLQPTNKPQRPNMTQLRRYPSGNNNTANTITIAARHLPQCSVRKSTSLPNLRESNEIMTCSLLQQQQQQANDGQQQKQQLNVSQAVSTSTMESCKSRNLLPMCQMPISISVSVSERLQSENQQAPPAPAATTQVQQVDHVHRHKHRCCCVNTISNNTSTRAVMGANSQNSCTSATLAQPKQSHISGSTSSGNSNPPAFNLVKLFIKQKSSNCSTEDQQASAHTCMDVSSGCWHSSDAACSSSSSLLEQRLRKKSMNDSGKGSAVSRHDEADDESRERETGHSTPRRQLRSRNDAVFYDEDAYLSSTGSLTATNSPAHRRRSMPLRNPQLYQLAAADSFANTNSQQSSDASRSNSEQITQVYLSTGTNASSNVIQKSRDAEISRPISTASSSEMITRSMQTSCGSLSTRSSLSDRYRCVPPSFLAKLNNLGEERQAPIYVIYPNYALPDLGFVKTNTSPDVIFSPFNYKMTMGDGIIGSAATLKNRFSLSDNDDEILRTMDYKHVKDWQSLATLLPVEYRRRLKHIPEVNNIMHDLDAELSQRPLFCMSPPIRRNRPHICDCSQYFQQQHQQQQQTQVEEGGNSSSGSSQQPSSGYRGSSTLLTDSDIDNADPLKQMYVYQYEQQRMDSGVESSPGSAKQTPPIPMPRSILRKGTSAQARTKRNSMIEAHQSKLSKLEKRRSLQEPPYNYAVGSAEELSEVFEEETDVEPYDVQQPRKERLSRKDQDARARAENFLTSLPRNELKYYAEIAAILESSEPQVQYDAAALKKEVSRVLSQQKKVSFNDTEGKQQQLMLHAESRHKRFSTPPNSPNISIAGGRVPTNMLRRLTLEEQEQRKIESNRFKRLQIQWELMSKDSTMLKDLANLQATRSGGSTPTSSTATPTTATANTNVQKSRIPRPVSYPAGKRTERIKTITKSPQVSAESEIKNVNVSPQIARISTQDAVNSGKTTRSPSRIVPPKRYSMATPPGTVQSPNRATTPTSATRARTPTSRTAPNTPKRSVPTTRAVSKVR